MGHINARRIINGTDKARAISDYAIQFERAIDAAYKAADKPKPVKPVQVPKPPVKPAPKPNPPASPKPKSRWKFSEWLASIWAAFK